MAGLFADRRKFKLLNSDPHIHGCLDSMQSYQRIQLEFQILRGGGNQLPCPETDLIEKVALLAPFDVYAVKRIII